MAAVGPILLALTGGAIAMLSMSKKDAKAAPGESILDSLPPGPPPKGSTGTVNPLAAEFARMPKATRTHIEGLLRGTDHAAMINAAAVMQANGFPHAAKALADRALAVSKGQAPPTFTTQPVIDTRSPGQPTAPAMPLDLRQELATALQRLTVQPDGSIKGPVDKTDIQFATAVAGRLEREGFPGPAAQLRDFAQKAGKFVPSPPPDKTVDLPGVPSDLKDKINRALDLERDPGKLRILLAALKSLPKSPDRDILIASLEALIVQIEAKNAADDAAREAEKIVKDPAPPAAPKPAPVPVRPVPTEPVPQPAPLPKSREAVLAQGLATHLINAQRTHGMPGAKTRFDQTLTKNFQGAVGEVQDAKPGPNTFLAMARLGVSTMPIVMFWPRSATLTNVDDYRQTLLTLADAAASAGQATRAAELRASAERERGQGGVVQVHGVLRQSTTGTARAAEFQRMTSGEKRILSDAISSNSAGRLQNAAIVLQSKYPQTAKFLMAEAAKTKVS